MLEHICKDYNQFIREPIYIESRQFAPTKDDFIKTVQQMANSLFSHQSLFSYEELIQFRMDIMKEIYTFEFRCFKKEDNVIDGVDFARSIVKYA